MWKHRHASGADTKAAHDSTMLASECQTNGSQPGRSKSSRVMRTHKNKMEQELACDARTHKTKAGSLFKHPPILKCSPMSLSLSSEVAYLGFS
jgi:hypothetical protein